MSQSSDPNYVKWQHHYAYLSNMIDIFDYIDGLQKCNRDQIASIYRFEFTDVRTDKWQRARLFAIKVHCDYESLQQFLIAERDRPRRDIPSFESLEKSIDRSIKEYDTIIEFCRNVDSTVHVPGRCIDMTSANEIFSDPHASYDIYEHLTKLTADEQLKLFTYNVYRYNYFNKGSRFPNITHEDAVTDLTTGITWNTVYREHLVGLIRVLVETNFPKLRDYPICQNWMMPDVHAMYVSRQRKECERLTATDHMRRSRHDERL